MIHKSLKSLCFGNRHVTHIYKYFLNELNNFAISIDDFLQKEKFSIHSPHSVLKMLSTVKFYSRSFSDDKMVYSVTLHLVR